MIDIVNLQALLDDHQRKTKPKRVASGEKRVVSLQREEKRLNGQKA
ncbi:hypothetical protein FITA111629_07360 [Filibacter tadaridae]|uniref:Uncharacterized protein n=1 Tax=Filibacter tadaridae TaxID=2483811 RepID=A0A3P5XKC7_9BACL|nr:hypothetical protein [Filibacter tadaridae]VDC28126.1 hypothetical protein FILTAD_01747 [Filibacter tadaridae]